MAAQSCGGGGGGGGVGVRIAFAIAAAVVAGDTRMTGEATRSMAFLEYLSRVVKTVKCAITEHDEAIIITFGCRFSDSEG